MTPRLEVHLGGIWDVSNFAKSRVTGISGLQAIGYTLGRLRGCRCHRSNKNNLTKRPALSKIIFLLIIV